MADGFEVKVPITIKGGREGEKVGKQIGEKIAAQLKKSLRVVGVGGGGAGGAGLGEVAGMAGMTKGLGKVATKLGVIGVAIGAAVGLLAKSSPYLKGILSIFGRAFMIFFRPFGDFLATLLRPLAILMMKMAVAFLKWTRPISGKVREAMEEVPQIGKTGNLIADIPIEIANWALKLGAALGAVIFEIGKAAFDLGTKIGDWLFNKVIEPAGEYLADKIMGAWNWVKNFPNWVWEKVTSIWNWTKDLGGWLWEKIIGIWNYAKDLGGWLWDTMINAFSNLGGWLSGLASWLWTTITNAFSNIWGWLSGIGMYLYDKITDSIKSAFSGFAFGWSWFWKKGQVGIPNVPHDGPYYLHKGEEVVPKTKVGGNKSVILSPSFNFSGTVSKDIDVDAIARRASRMTERELKQRGIL